jgi:hypothetical protein
VTTLSVGPTGGWSAPIVLKLRPQVSGRVLSPAQLPVRDLLIAPALATVAASSTATSLALLPKVPSAQTDADGRFAVRLDSAIYDFGLIPPPTALLPRVWIEGTQVTADLTLPDVTLPEGTTARGHVLGPTGAPLAGATVRLYSLAQGNTACPSSDYACLSPPRLRAEGTTGATGLVPLLLPAAPRN